MSSIDLIEQSKDFPIHCRQMICFETGKSLDLYFEYLDKFIKDMVSQVDSVFDNRKEAVRLAKKSEGAGELKQSERIKIQISQYELSRLIKDLQAVTDEFKNYSTYSSLGKPFTQDEFVGKFYKRYQLSEAVYQGLINAATRSIGSLKESLERHFDSSKRMANAINSANKNSGLKKAVAIGASVVGGILGATVAHKVGIRRGGGRAGAAGASALVAGMFGDTKKLELAVSDYADSFDQIHSKWVAVKPSFQREVEIVIYSICGGAVLKLLDDLKAASVVVRIDRLGFTGDSMIARASLTSETENDVKKWAEESIRKLKKLHEDELFSKANIIAQNALQFTLQFEPRIKIKNSDNISYSILFQRMYLQSFVHILRSAKDATNSIKILDELLPNLTVLPDRENDSELVTLMIELDRLMRSPDKKVARTSTGILIEIYKFYSTRRKYILGDQRQCWSFPGETCSLEALHLLHGFINKGQKVGVYTNDVKFDAEAENCLYKYNPQWTLKCIRLLKQNGARLSDLLYGKLVKRFVMQCFLAATVILFIALVVINFDALSETVKSVYLSR